MLESVSPYALLRASIPRPVAQQATAYDLFSVSQSVPRPQADLQAVLPAKTPADAQPEPAPQPEPDVPPQTQAAQDVPAMPPSPRIPVKRTHYISDIQSRHSAAVRQTTFVTPQP